MIQPPVTAAESGRSVRSFCGSLLLLLFSPRIFCFNKVVKKEARSHEGSGARRTLESWRSGGNGAREKSDECRDVSEVLQISLSSLCCHIASQDVIFSTVMRIPSHTKEV